MLRGFWTLSVYLPSDRRLKHTLTIPIIDGKFSIPKVRNTVIVVNRDLNWVQGQGHGTWPPRPRTWDWFSYSPTRVSSGSGPMFGRPGSKLCLLKTIDVLIYPVSLKERFIIASNKPSLTFLKATLYLLRPSREAEYCDESVCLSVHAVISRTTRDTFWSSPHFSHLSSVAEARSYILRRRCNTL